MEATVKQTEVDLSKRPIENYEKFCRIKDTLVELGVSVIETEIDNAAFTSWLQSFDVINRQYKDYGDVRIEKCLEHYLSNKFLAFNSDDVYIDIAACNSPFANELEKRNMVSKSYLLDLSYEEGIHGNRIGADASNTKLDDEFADKLSLQCAYECFQGTSDIGFITESARILSKTGKFVITPLYIDEVYFNCTSEKCDQSKIDFDADAVKARREDGHIVPFSRHYSPESFVERVYRAAPSNLNLTVYFFSNLPELMAQHANQKIYCYFLLEGTIRS